MSSEFLNSVIRWKVERKGSSRLLPYLYYEIAWIAGIYTASTANVRKLIPTSDLWPIELFPGRCLVAIAFFDYKELDHEPYMEANISFLVQHGKRPLPAVAVMNMIRSKVFPSYIWQLPLTSEYHCTGGVELYGYPKFVADIEFNVKKNHLDCTLSISDNIVIHLIGNVLPIKSGPKMRFITYTIDDNVLMSANVIVNPIHYGESRARNDLVLEIGENHTICETLRSINLSSQPLLYQYSPHGEAILFPGRNAIDA